MEGSRGNITEAAFSLAFSRPQGPGGRHRLAWYLPWTERERTWLFPVGASGIQDTLALRDDKEVHLSLTWLTKVQVKAALRQRREGKGGLGKEKERFCQTRKLSRHTKMELYPVVVVRNPETTSPERYSRALVRRGTMT
eukprot:757734-Hanusia_phi.AAC.8